MFFPPTLSLQLYVVFNFFTWDISSVVILEVGKETELKQAKIVRMIRLLGFSYQRTHVIDLTSATSWDSLEHIWSLTTLVSQDETNI